jgi:hypothetical protein
MSETEHIKGRLIPIAIIGDAENTAKIILELEKVAIPDYLANSPYLYILKEELYRKYLFLDGKFYKVDSLKKDDNDVYLAHNNPDGSIDFELVYYNGGCSFDDAIGCALGRMEKKN